MNRKETIDRAYRNMRNGKNRDLIDLFWSIEKSIQMFIPIVMHGKEMTDEYNDFPTTSNRVVMELARRNVVVAAEKLSEKLTSIYEELSTSSKRVLPFAEFAEIVQERLTNLLEEE